MNQDNNDFDMYTFPEKNSKYHVWYMMGRGAEFFSDLQL